MYGMTPIGIFFTAIFPLKVNEQALCQQPNAHKSQNTASEAGKAKNAPKSRKPLISVRFLALPRLDSNQWPIA